MGLEGKRDWLTTCEKEQRTGMHCGVAEQRCVEGNFSIANQNRREQTVKKKKKEKAAAAAKFRRATINKGH